MKKLINKIGVITFSLSPILIIASTASSSLASDSSQSRFTQSFKTKLRKSFKNSKWIEQTKSNSASNITNGFKGTIFEDSRGNLWSMGFGTKLQKYDYNTKRWTEETRKNSGSKIINGWNGTIFEDSQGNLWSMGNGTPLQKYKYTTKRWMVEKGDISGNNIINGDSGTIFEDSQGNLWSMGWGTSLQKYDYQTKRWTVETSVSNGSNIIDGFGGTIFEDSRGKLWSMGNETLLQKYNYKTKKWAEETRESSGSNIINGRNGIIFEDSRGNLWSMGAETKLQRYNYTTKRWIAETSESSGNNIKSGSNGTIFEDSRGNLWSMGDETLLQKYDYKTEKWAEETSEISGSNITDGWGGTIFEDSRGNLWSMGNKTPLQKYNYTTKRWTTETSNITNGSGGTIFEDSRGNLWSMGNGTKLQKLTPIEETNPNEQKIKDFNIEFKTKINTDSKISISIKGYRKYTSNLFTHLQYKNKRESSWKVVRKKTMMLDARKHKFKWVLGTEETLVNKQKLPKKITISIQPSDIAKVKTFLSGLSVRDINSLVNPNKLVSVVTKDEILDKIKLNSGYSKLTNAQKALITTNLITKTNDPDGTLKVKINYGIESFVFVASGFFRVADHNNTKVKEFLSSLSNSVLSSLTNSNKLVAVITKAEILEQIKATSGYKKLTNAQKALITTNLITKTNDPDGTLKVKINYEGEQYELNVSGFFRIADHDNITKIKEFLSSLSNSNLSSLTNSNELVEIVTKNEILEQIKATSGYKKLTNAQKALITTNLITKTNDPDGTLKVKINYEGEQYELNVSGFLKVADNNIAKVKAFLWSLNNSDLSSWGISTKLVSAVTKAEILNKIKSTRTSLTNDQKALITTNLMTKTNEPDGTLKVTINYEGHKYELIASGFLKVADDNIAKIKTFLSSLSNSDLSSLANATKLVGAITKTEILKKIKLARGYKALSQAQKALVTEDLITKAEDVPGTLKITINFKSKSHEFNILGFKITTAQNKQKVKDFLGALPSTLVDSLSEATKLVSAVTKAEILTKIKEASGYSSLAPAEQGLIIEDLITIANDPDGTLKVTILFDSETYEHSKDGFKLSSVHNIERVKAFLGSLDDSSISSLAIDTKPVSLVTKTEILKQIKATSGYKKLTNAQRALITTNLITKTNDPDGTLKVTITYKDGIYEFTASGFLKAADDNIAKVKAFLWSLNNSDISSLAIANKLVSLVTKTKILKQIKATGGYKKLSNAQRALITTNLITKSKEPEGTLKVTITFEGDTRELIASGFLKATDDNIAKVKTFLKSLSNSDLSSLANDTKLAGAITKIEILEKIKLARGYKALSQVQKALVTEDLITKAKDVPGTLKITINFESESYEFNILGFKITTTQNKKQVKDFLGALPSTLVDPLSDSTKLVSAVTKAEILAKIKETRGYSSLTPVQQGLIIEDLITIENDPDGTLKVTILFDGESYEYSRSGFKLTLQVEANKFQDFASTNTIKSDAATLKSNSKDVLSTFKKISGYQRPTNLASDISITKVIVKKALNPQTRKVKFELTIARQGKIVTKDVIVTFKALKAITKLSKKESNKKRRGGLSTGAIVGISLGSILVIGIVGFLIFYLVRSNKKRRNKK